jgi:hypothetical protein
MRKKIKSEDCKLIKNLMTIVIGMSNDELLFRGCRNIIIKLKRFLLCRNDKRTDRFVGFIFVGADNPIVIKVFISPNGFRN